MNLTVYLRALRLPFLTGSMWPVAVAAALAYWQEGVFRAGFLGLTALGVAGLHLGANLLNDYYDAFGSDPINIYFTPFSGGSRVIQQGELTAETVRALAYLLLGLGVLCGLVLIYLGRPGVALIGLVGLAAGYFYSATPVQLMSTGLGELTIFYGLWPPPHLGGVLRADGEL